jgi:hypothetical protein
MKTAQEIIKIFERIVETEEVEKGEIQINHNETTYQIGSFRNIKINNEDMGNGRLYIYPEAEVVIIDKILGGNDIAINLIKTPIDSLIVETHQFGGNPIVEVI